MARLDPFIERLFSESASELLLETGAGAVLACPRGPVSLIKQPLTAQQILGALAEVLPDDRRDGFPAPGTTVFPYVSPHGTVEVRLEVADGKTRAVVSPYGADGFETDSGGRADRRVRARAGAREGERGLARSRGPRARTAPARRAPAPGGGRGTDLRSAGPARGD